MEPSTSVLPSKRKKKSIRTLDALAKGEKIHIRLIGESFSVIENKNYLPLKPKKNDEPSDFFTEWGKIKGTPEYSYSPYMKNWELDHDPLDNWVLKTCSVRHKTNNPTKNFNIEHWLGKEHLNTDQETFQQHYGILTSSVMCYRRILVFSENDTHYKISTYTTDKIRLCGYRYFRQKRAIHSIILNKKTGDIYLREAIFNNRKWTVKLKRNSMHELINALSKYCPFIGNFQQELSGIGILGTDNGQLLEQTFTTRNEVRLMYEHVNKIVNVLGVDLTPYQDCPYPYHNITLRKPNYVQLVPSNMQTLSMTLILWFLKKKGIKYPNNPFAILQEHYPTIKILRKHNMNLVHAALSTLGIKSKSTIKLLNQYPTISCFTMMFWYHFLGHDYFIQLNPQIFNRGSMKYAMLDTLTRFGIEINSFTDVFNNKALWHKINTAITKEEKYQIFRIFRSTNPSSEDIPSILEFSDHLTFKKQLLEYNDVVKFKARNIDEFRIEHRLWSDKIYHYQKDKIIRYSYMKIFLETVEQPLMIDDFFENVTAFYPIILTTDSEYEQESSIQSHCVKTYINAYNSIIISVRKDNVESYDRVTCEYQYDAKTNAFKSIQKKGKHNAQPKDDFIPILKELDNKLNRFAKTNEYSCPTVTEINKHSQAVKVLSGFNTQSEILDF